MNKAFKHVLYWYLTESEFSAADVERAVFEIEAGIAREDERAAALLVTVLDRAATLAADSGNETVLELLAVGKELVVAEAAVHNAGHLLEIRSILDMPPTHPIATRIRNVKIQEAVKALIG